MEQAAIRVGLTRRSDPIALARGAAPLALWAALIVAAWAWGTALNDSGARIALGAPPLFGRWDLQLTPSILPAVGIGALVVWVAPRLTASLTWPRLLGAVGSGALVWSLALAASEGVTGISGPLEGPSDYLGAVPLVGSPGEFLSTFTERIDGYPTHVRSHPPGMVLILWSMSQVGLGGSGPAAALVLLVAASAPVAVLIAARAVAGEGAARRAAPFLVLLPAAVWIGTTADAFFMGVAAWAVTLLILAIRSTGRRTVGFAIAGGVLFGVVGMLSYGLALVGLVASAVALGSRRAVPQAIAAAAAASVLLVTWAVGYQWVDGFFAIRDQYLGSVAQTRPYDFFLLSNLAAFGLAVGPAAALGLGRVRGGGLGLLVGGAVAAVVLADLTGMSKAEVERIWLVFVPWVVLAVAALPREAMRPLLAAQAALAIAIEVGVEMIW